MKKKWLTFPALLLAAAAVVMVGCGNSTTPGNGEGEEEVWKLTTELAAMVDGGIAIDTALVEANFTNTALQAAGNPTMKIVTNGTGDDAPLALAIETGANWGEGLDLRDSVIGFKAGDTITITGKILENFPPAPSSGDTWATPLLFLKVDLGADVFAASFNNTQAGAFQLEYTLTQADIGQIKTTGAENPACIRIGARPGGAKFQIDEITLIGIREGTASPTYTVTFLASNANGAETLGTATVESGVQVSRPAAETWYTTYLGTLTDQIVTGWKLKSDNTAWDFVNNTVTENISLYPVLAATKLSAVGIKVDSVSVNVAVNAVSGTLEAITDGYTFTRLGGYASSYAWFAVTFGEGVKLADFKQVTLTYQGVSGDISYKDIVLLAKSAAFSGSLGSDTDISNMQIHTGTKTQVTGTTATPVTISIDPTKAAAYNTIAGEQTVYFSIYLHAAATGSGNPTAFKISNIAFVKNVVESYTVDLSGLAVTNTTDLADQNDGFSVALDSLGAEFDITKYSKITVKGTFQDGSDGSTIITPDWGLGGVKIGKGTNASKSDWDTTANVYIAINNLGMDASDWEGAGWRNASIGYLLNATEKAALAAISSGGWAIWLSKADSGTEDGKVAKITLTEITFHN
jgi:hypothetical protein